MIHRTLCTLACLALLAPAVLAATPADPPPAAVAQPAEPVPAALQTPAGPPAIPPADAAGDTLALFPEEPAATGGQCTASTQCQSGARISCEGSDCDVYPGCWVVCDCQEILCPPPLDPNAPPCPWPRSIC